MGIHDKNQVREVVNKAASELLLLVELALHLAAGGNIHNGTLITEDVTGGIADGSGGVQTNDGGTILAEQSNFMALGRILVVDSFLERFSFRGVGEEVREAPAEQIFLGFITEHANESGIGVDDGAV